MSEQLESLVLRVRGRAAPTLMVTMGLLLSACGQKGPLTLASPTKASTVSSAARPAATPATPAALPASAPPARTWGSPPP